MSFAHYEDSCSRKVGREYRVFKDLYSEYWDTTNQNVQESCIRMLQPKASVES